MLHNALDEHIFFRPVLTVYADAHTCAGQSHPEAPVVLIGGDLADKQTDSLDRS